MLEDMLPCKLTLTVNAIPVSVQEHMESWCMYLYMSKASGMQMLFVVISLCW